MFVAFASRTAARRCTGRRFVDYPAVVDAVVAFDDDAGDYDDADAADDDGGDGYDGYVDHVVDDGAVVVVAVAVAADAAAD
eukprot:4284369-Alexandrium_andersonii.AAC.1